MHTSDIIIGSGIAIKHSQGKLRFQGTFDDFISHQLAEQGIQLLNITFEHLSRVNALPYHHRDPFDRLIVAQSIHEQIAVIGNDAMFDRYGIKRIW